MEGQSTWLPWGCREISDGLTLLPLRDGLLVDPDALSEGSQALLTFLLLNGLPPSWWRSRVKCSPQRFLRIGVQEPSQLLNLRLGRSITHDFVDSVAPVTNHTREENRTSERDRVDPIEDRRENALNVYVAGT